MVANAVGPAPHAARQGFPASIFYQKRKYTVRAIQIAETDADSDSEECPDNPPFTEPVHPVAATRLVQVRQSPYLDDFTNTRVFEYDLPLS